ncbi:hypothetical protein FH972_025064 [Carpinus fangiana]|uniref:RidA family protein n=1 Tax=Carpinus fangiana TaxID=176857 RepID=A0A5N6KZY5_9ROSI|nr:hypothetical protein FH972_025064 [Carpinus fangiana]
MEFINAGDAPRPNGRYTHVVRNRSTIFVAGWMGDDPRTSKIVEGGIEKQTERAIKNIEICLKAAGTDLQHVVRRRLYFIDIQAHLRIVDSVWGRYVDEPYPVSTAIQVGGLAKEGALIEIEVTAALPPNR